MSTTKRTKDSVTVRYQQLINALNKYLPNKTLVLGGKPVTTEAGVAMLQQQLTGMQTSADAHAAWLQSVAKERATTKASITPFITMLRHYVAAFFGTDSDEYRAFGFPQPKPRTKSPKASVIGAAKNAATRKARNTMGSKQRLAITGAVPSTLVLPVPTPVAPGEPAPAAETAQPKGAVTVTTSNGSGNGSGGGTGNGTH